MKTFVMINGKNLYTVKKETLGDARDYAVNYMNHSNEVIVREITSSPVDDKIELATEQIEELIDQLEDVGDKNELFVNCLKLILTDLNK